MQLKNKTTKQVILSLVLISMLASFVLFSSPKKADAAWWSTWLTDISSGATAGSTAVGTASTVTNTGISIKKVAQEITRQVFMTVARRFLQELTKSTVNWINTGNFGNPLFVENPKSFFGDIAKYEIRTMVDTFGYDPVRFPYGKSFALNVINSYKRTLEENAQYSLSTAIRDPVLLNSYRNNFNVGSWNGFLVNSQFPQNNYLGFTMLATNNLAQKLSGTAQTNAEKVQTALSQGMGFLSPMTCPSNPAYNTLKNQFQRPSYKPVPYDGGPAPVCVDDNNRDDAGNCAEETEESYFARQNAYAEWALKNNMQKIAWDNANTCPNGLVSTTPGSVVASQITNAMGSQFRQSELAAAMGNSISAVLDAFINKFIGSGLNSLATKVSPKQAPDTWDYYGNTLGSSPTGGTNVAWNSGPDEVVDLVKFKKEVNDGIANTTLELKLLSNEDTSDPGIVQMVANIWPKTRDLDMCVPGPNLGWEKRLEDEMARNSKTLTAKTNDEDGKVAAQADLALRELKYAVAFFKDWVKNNMISPTDRKLSLPNSVLYMSAVEELDGLQQQMSELTNKQRTKTQTLARLKSIKTALDSITTPPGSTQPGSGSGQEKVMIELRKQYTTIMSSISSAVTIDDAKNELFILKDQYNKISKMVTECTDARLAAGWTNGWANPGKNSSTYLDKGTEQNLFCDFPIKGGFNHDTFTHANDGANDNNFGQIVGGNPGALIQDSLNPTGPAGAVTHPEIPYVNARNVLSWPRWGGILGNHKASIAINCNIVFNSNKLDYKGDLPGSTTTIIDEYIDPGNNTDPGEEETETTGPTYPTPTGGAFSSLAADVQAERSKYGATITSSQAASILNTVAWNNRAAGWGLSRKTGGAKCASPAGDIACDILHHQPTNTIVDVLIAGPNDGGPPEAGTATWNVLGTQFDANRPWVAPVQP